MVAAAGELHDRAELHGDILVAKRARFEAVRSYSVWFPQKTAFSDSGAIWT
jgi:hypothetical protein